MQQHSIREEIKYVLALRVLALYVRSHKALVISVKPSIDGINTCWAMTIFIWPVDSVPKLESMTTFP